MNTKLTASLISLLILLAPLSRALAIDKIIGINEVNLRKIPIGIVNIGLPDQDQDGLDDELEKSIGTNPQVADSDKDGYSDAMEIANNYNPLGPGKINIDRALANKLAGYYLLRVEKHGELWYVNPNDKKRYLVNTNTRKALTFAKLFPTQTTQPASDATGPNNDILSLAAEKIRNNDKANLLKLISPELAKSVNFSMDTLSPDQRLLWANILSSAKLIKQTSTEKTFQAAVYFSPASKDISVNFILTKQPDNAWLISNL